MQAHENLDPLLIDPILTPGIQSFIRDSIGVISSIRKVSGGLVHHVYKVTREDNSYYLKVRGSTFAALPSIVSNPKEIIYEKLALEIFSNAIPDVFPHVIAFNGAKSALLMTDVNPSECTLAKSFDNGLVNSGTLKSIGNTLGRVHRELQKVPAEIRATGEQEQYELNLNRRLLGSNNPVLDNVAQKLRKLPRQLILGEISPKNVGVNNNDQITFFDLETAHMGNTIFDVGYLLGHIMLHSFYYPGKMSEFTDAVLTGYEEEQLEFNRYDPLLWNIAAAAILYRLENKVVPYHALLSEAQSQVLIEIAYDMINSMS